LQENKRRIKRGNFLKKVPPFPLQKLSTEKSIAACFCIICGKMKKPSPAGEGFFYAKNRKAPLVAGQAIISFR